MASGWITHLRRAVALAWFVSLFALLGLVGVGHLAPHTGHTLVIIRGASMEPAIPLGSLVAIQPVDAQLVGVGEVVTIRADNGVLVTHRVVDVLGSGPERQLQLRGDANASADASLVPVRSLVGRVAWFAPVAGYALFLLSVPSGILTFLSLLGALLLLYWLLEDLEVDARRAARRRLLVGMGSAEAP